MVTANAGQSPMSQWFSSTWKRHIATGTEIRAAHLPPRGVSRTPESVLCGNMAIAVVTSRLADPRRRPLRICRHDAAGKVCEAVALRPGSTDTCPSDAYERR